jgi:hypothetical protein
MSKDARVGGAVLRYAKLSLIDVWLAELNRHDPDKDAAAVRADQPIPSQAGVYYYEVEVISKGQKGYIGIGFSTRGVDLERLPGKSIEPRPAIHEV